MLTNNYCSVILQGLWTIEEDHCFLWGSAATVYIINWLLYLSHLPLKMHFSSKETSSSRVPVYYMLFITIQVYQKTKRLKHLPWEDPNSSVLTCSVSSVVSLRRRMLWDSLSSSSAKCLKSPCREQNTVSCGIPWWIVQQGRDQQAQPCPRLPFPECPSSLVAQWDIALVYFFCFPA